MVALSTNPTNTDNSTTTTPADAAASQPQESDLSRNTIIVLVMLTLIISVLGTWTVLNEVSGIKVTTKTSGPATADVKLNIMTPEQYAALNAPPKSGATGNVVFNILK